MARRTVRVDVPVKKPEELMNLAQGIVNQHNAPGATSKLDPIRMKQLAAALTQAQAQHKDAKNFAAQAQTATQARNIFLGTAPDLANLNQIGTTVLDGVTYARDQLLIDNAGNEEALSKSGFNVVVGTAKLPTKKSPKTA